jgi:hypothetical protein
MLSSNARNGQATAAAFKAGHARRGGKYGNAVLSDGWETVVHQDSGSSKLPDIRLNVLKRGSYSNLQEKTRKKEM